MIEEPVYNRHLKDIAKLAGITRKVSNKVARHTNAQLLVRYGAAGSVLSKMMGYTKEETTKNIMILIFQRSWKERKELISGGWVFNTIFLEIMYPFCISLPLTGSQIRLKLHTECSAFFHRRIDMHF